MHELKTPDGKISISCKPGEVSDGYHTFDELYDHRCLLFIALMQAYSEFSWRLLRHHDGSMMDGWFIGGMDLNGKSITYHLPDKYWELMDKTSIPLLHKAPEWDGHTSGDVLQRLTDWISLQPYQEDVESGY